MRALLLGASLCLLALPAAAQGLVPTDFFNAPIDPASSHRGRGDDAQLRRRRPIRSRRLAAMRFPTERLRS